MTEADLDRLDAMASEAKKRTDVEPEGEQRWTDWFEAVVSDTRHLADALLAAHSEIRLLWAILGDKITDDARLAEGYRRGVIAALAALWKERETERSLLDLYHIIGNLLK